MFTGTVTSANNGGFCSVRCAVLCRAALRCAGLAAPPPPAPTPTHPVPEPPRQVRCRNLEPALDLSPYEGVELRLKGDGQRYKLILRSESAWDGIGYTASFDTQAGGCCGARGGGGMVVECGHGRKWSAEVERTRARVLERPAHVGAACRPLLGVRGWDVMGCFFFGGGVYPGVAASDSMTSFLPRCHLLSVWPMALEAHHSCPLLLLPPLPHPQPQPQPPPTAPHTLTSTNNAVPFQPAPCRTVPAGVWQTVRLPFSKFVPVFRARTVRDAPPLDTSHIYSFQARGDD